MQKPEDFDLLMRNIQLAADHAILQKVREVPTPTLATLARTAVQAAVTSALVRDMIILQPREKWAPLLTIEPEFED
jgi:hypothetical protein